MLFVLNANGVPAIAPIISVGGPATMPAAPTGVTASPLDGGAGVTWAAPSNGGSPITSYTVTPYIGSVAQPVTVVSGSPAPTSANVTGLTNGTTYTFTVTATNAVGSSPASALSNAVTPNSAPPPAFVQQASGHSGTGSSLSVSLKSTTLTGDRLVVETSVWSSGSATVKSVTDTAGDTFTELTHFTAADNTEESVWTAPIATGSSTAPTITVTPTAKADIGAAVLEYSGLSTASGTAVLDQSAHAVGKTGTGTPSVASGATPATTGTNELALGFYADSGFGDTLAGASGWTPRVSISKASDMELLVEDQVVPLGATPNASVTTGANTYWLMSTVVLKNASASQLAQISQALRRSAATPSAGSVATPSAGSLATPGAATTAQNTASPLRSSAVRHSTLGPVRCAGRHLSAAGRRACASLRHAAAVAKRARRHWIYDALLENLSPKLLCHHWDGKTLRGLQGLAAGWYAAV
jgi:hypothetical protein